MSTKEATPARASLRAADRGETTERSKAMSMPRQFLKKALVGWLIYSVGFSPLTLPAAWAASTEFSDVPLPAKKRPLPNLIMAIDDSGSMDFETSFNGNDGALWFNTLDGRFHGRLNSPGDPLGGPLAPAPDNVTSGCASTEGLSTCVNGPTNFNTTGNPGNPASTSWSWKKYVYLCTNAILLEKHLDRFPPSKYLTFSIHLDGPREEHDHHPEDEDRVRDEVQDGVALNHFSSALSSRQT